MKVGVSRILIKKQNLKRYVIKADIDSPNY